MSGSAIFFLGNDVLKIEDFSVSGTWTAPDGVNNILAFGCGGGSGGAATGYATGDADNSSGGFGAVPSFRVFPVTPGTTYTITIGAGGAGGTVSSPGSAGGDSIIVGVGSWPGAPGHDQTGTGMTDTNEASTFDKSFAYKGELYTAGGARLTGSTGADGSNSPYAAGGTDGGTGAGGGGAAIGAGGNGGSTGVAGTLGSGGGGGNTGGAGGNGFIRIIWTENEE